MIVYFLRHASAGKSVPDRDKDRHRALDQEGIEQCRYVGRLLAALEVQVDLVISSPLKRATQTAAQVSNELGYEGKLQFDDALLPGADYNAFRQLLQKHHKQDAVMVVGHNPSLSSFLSLAISRRGADEAVDLKKGAVARVEVSNKSAVLQWCVTPKIARALYASSAKRSRPKTSRK
jgi:phosphohistidine phosphatase